MSDGSRIRDARHARGWSQARLVHEIERRLTGAGALTATAASLKVYVSEWENGHRAVGLEYRKVLRSIFGMTDAELFQNVPDQVPIDHAYAELAGRIEIARTVDRRMVETLAKQTELLRSIDRQMGAAGLVDQMAAHLTTLEDALAYSVLASSRRPVAAVLSSASTLAGWQALDVGAVDRAWRHYELARRAAIEAESAPLLAHAMGEQAYVLVDLGQPALAVELVREAINAARRKAPGRLLAWLFSAEAEICALLGDEAPGRRALDAASQALPGGEEPRDEAVPGLFLNDAHLRRWRGNALALLGDGGAVDDLYGALAGMDGTFTRATAGLYLDLAQAHIARGEPGDAREQVRTARLLIARTGSLRHRRRLDNISARLAE
jgi:transcriptional regulator with XRE-family HTH domain